MLGASGKVIGLRCSVLEETLGGKNPADGRKVWGVLHWVSTAHAARVEARLYDRLFSVARPDEGGDFRQHLNPHSLEIVEGALAEPSLARAEPGSRWQFERIGYFAVDPKLKGDKIEVRFDPFPADEQPREVQLYSLGGIYLGVGRRYRREKGYHRQPDPPAGKGYKFKNSTGVADGVQKLLYKGGALGKSKAIVKGKGASIPTGIPAALQTSAFATMQLRASDGFCLSVKVDDIKKQQPASFKAKFSAP